MEKLIYEAVTKRYPHDAGAPGEEAAGALAVDHVSLSIPEGCLVVFLGPSGCGKTTLLKMTNRLIEPTGGAIRLDGQDIRAMEVTGLRRRMGYVIQQVGLFPHMTVEANVAVAPDLLGWPKARTRARVAELLELVHLPPGEYARRYPAQLSGGQQQRVGLARALAADPEVLLMDEPFGAIDAITRAALQEEVLRLQGALRKTVLFVTHDVEEALRLADRIAVLRAGKLVQYGDPCSLLNHPADAFVGALLGADDRLRGLSLLRVEDFARAPGTAGAVPARDSTVDSSVRNIPAGSSLRDSTVDSSARNIPAGSSLRDSTVDSSVRNIPAGSSLREAVSALLAPGVGRLRVVAADGRSLGWLGWEEIRGATCAGAPEEGG